MKLYTYIKIAIAREGETMKKVSDHVGYTEQGNFTHALKNCSISFNKLKPMAKYLNEDLEEIQKLWANENS